jgi:uncharacterized protein (DUF2141 family)
MMQPEINTGLLVEFDSVRMRSNLVLVAIYKKGQNFNIFQNYRDRMTKKWMQFHVSFLSEADEMHTRK